MKKKFFGTKVLVLVVATLSLFQFVISGIQISGWIPSITEPNYMFHHFVLDPNSPWVDLPCLYIKKAQPDRSAKQEVKAILDRSFPFYRLGNDKQPSVDMGQKRVMDSVEIQPFAIQVSIPVYENEFVDGFRDDGFDGRGYLVAGKWLFFVLDKDAAAADEAAEQVLSEMLEKQETGPSH